MSHVHLSVSDTVAELSRMFHSPRSHADRQPVLRGVSGHVPVSDTVAKLSRIACGGRCG
jgi:hypothetical protein